MNQFFGTEKEKLIKSNKELLINFIEERQQLQLAF
jgi:hypothetical protein